MSGENEEFIYFLPRLIYLLHFLVLIFYACFLSFAICLNSSTTEGLRAKGEGSIKYFMFYDFID